MELEFSSSFARDLKTHGSLHRSTSVLPRSTKGVMYSMLLWVALGIPVRHDPRDIWDVYFRRYVFIDPGMYSFVRVRDTNLQKLCG